VYNKMTAAILIVLSILAFARGNMEVATTHIVGALVICAIMNEGRRRG